MLFLWLVKRSAERFPRRLTTLHAIPLETPPALRADAAVSQRKEAVCAAKRELEAARDEIGALCERIAGEYAGLQLGRHALASELELLKQVRTGSQGGRRDSMVFEVAM